MAGLRFTDLQSRPMEFLDFTSLTLDEFPQLVPPFETAFQTRMAAWRMDGKPRTARRFTVYKNCPLPTPEDRLLFILVYLKTYALQVVHGRLFDMVQGKANQWIHVLLPALLAALRTLGDAPARSLTALAQWLGVSAADAATVVVPLAEEPVPVATAPAAPSASPLLPMTGRNGASSAPKTLLHRRNVRGYPETFSHGCTGSRSLLAVMKRRATAGRDSMQHKMYITDFDHSSTRFYTAFIVLTVPAIPAMPGVRPLNHPAFLQRREAFRACGTHLDFDAPAGTMLGHPGVQGVIVILLIRKDGDETRKIVGRDVIEQARSRHSIIESGTGNQDGQQQAQRIDQQMPLAPVDFFAAIIPALRAAHLGGLDRLTVDAGSTGGRLAPGCHTNPLAQGLDQLRPCPIVTPLGKIVIDGALGQQIMRQHIPLAATSVEVEQGIQDFPHVDLPRAPSSWVLFGGWDHRSHDCPLLVRQI